MPKHVQKYLALLSKSSVAKIVTTDTQTDTHTKPHLHKVSSDTYLINRNYTHHTELLHTVMFRRLQLISRTCV